jgi:hypothetical protein
MNFSFGRRPIEHAETIEQFSDRRDNFVASASLSRDRMQFGNDADYHY